MTKKRKDKRLEKKVTTGIILPNGKSERISVYGNTKAELERNVDDLKFKLKCGEYYHSNEFFDSYANMWYDTYKSMKRTKTKKMYRYVLDKYIHDEIGSMKLSDIKKADLQRIINNNFDHPRTCEQIRLTLFQIFNQAVEDDMLSKSPCHKLTMPVKEVNHKRPLTDIEKSAIQNAKYSDREKAFIYMLYFCGLAKCEALALNKNNFNFKKWEVRIQNDLVFNHNKPLIEPTKNKYRVRSIPIPSGARTFIKEYVDSLNQLYLFTKNDGMLITESSYDRMWEQIVKKTNEAACSENELKIHAQKISDLTAYVFRHNYATMLYYSNVSIKQAAKLMGHSDTTMILKIYSHLDESKENVVEKLNECINF